MTQPSNLSPTDREKVLAAYPTAFCHSPLGGWCYIDISNDTPMIGEGPTKDAAWADASSRIPSPASPDDVTNVEITDRQLCLLSQLFNRHGHEIPNTGDQFSINKWLEKRIAEARNAKR